MKNEKGIEEIVLKCHPKKQLRPRVLTVIKLGEFPVIFKNRGDKNKDYIASMHCIIGNEKEMYEAVFLHFSFLFRRSSPIISVSFDNVSFEKSINTPGIAHTHLFGETVNARMLDEYFKKYPNQITARIHPMIKGRFKEDSAFLKVPNIHSTKSCSSSLFKLFKGRDLRLFDCKFNTFDVVEFLMAWISGVSYQNLEVLYLFSPVSRNIDKRLVFARNGLTLWPENTPYMFEFVSREDPANNSDNKLTFDCRQCYQAKRKSDHKLAAIHINDNSILFLVFP